LTAIARPIADPDGQPDNEFGTGAGTVAQGRDRSAVTLNQRLDKSQPEPQPTRILGRADMALLEQVEQMW
jgi:hypothetical protein